VADPAAHLSDTEIAELDPAEAPDNLRVHNHLNACEACRRRRAELVGFREMLAQAGSGERRPPRDVVAAAMLRLRLRRYSISNANEVFEGLAALVRGLASLFSLPITGEQGRVHPRAPEDDDHG
jgi:predicted anti-sigma-YlaC factor YlaD